MDTEGNGMTWKLYEADCFDVFPSIEDKSIDMILCDLPYGTTACKWDTPLPLDKLWTEYKRVIKDNGAIVLTASQPFTSQLVMSNPNYFKYELIWNKKHGKTPGVAKYRPMASHESILIFGDSNLKYNPQWTQGTPYFDKREKPTKRENHFGFTGIYTTQSDGRRHPLSVIDIPTYPMKGQHPTQKPVALFEYLIRTYTNENDLVLDNCAGSGTTGVACQNLNRNCILIEKEPDYCQIIRERMRTVEDLIVEERKQQTLTDFIPAK